MENENFEEVLITNIRLEWHSKNDSKEDFADEIDVLLELTDFQERSSNIATLKFNDTTDDK